MSWALISVGNPVSAGTIIFRLHIIQTIENIVICRSWLVCDEWSTSLAVSLGKNSVANEFLAGLSVEDYIHIRYGTTSSTDVNKDDVNMKLRTCSG